jgi:YegS/Rv2252/BmrU family lipid kinase
MLRHARLIFNPNSGEAQKNAQTLDEIVSSLRAHGIVADIGIKTSGKAARELAREAAKNDEELVIVAAGDGTIEDVAAMLVGTKTALGIIPIGTMNNLARALGVPLELDLACALLGIGVTRAIDFGHVLADQKPDVEYFLETSGVGLSAIVIPAGQAAEKHRWEELPDAIRKLFDSKPGPVMVRLDGGEWIHAHAQVVTVSNAPLMGNNLLIAPNAKMDDGWLDVAIYDEMSKTELLAYFMSLTTTKHADNPKVKFYRARHVRIESQAPVEAHSDKDVVATRPVIEPSHAESQETGAEVARSGDVVTVGANGSLQAKYVLEVEIVPGALRMIAGKGMGLSLPVEAAPAVPLLSE